MHAAGEEPGPSSPVVGGNENDPAEELFLESMPDWNLLPVPNPTILENFQLTVTFDNLLQQSTEEAPLGGEDPEFFDS
jgi:hypothetical protein